MKGSVSLTQLPPVCQSPSEGFLERGGQGLNGAAICPWSSPLRDLFPQNPDKDLDGMETDLPIVVFLFWSRNLSSKHETAPLPFSPAVQVWKGEGGRETRQITGAQDSLCSVGKNPLLGTYGSCLDARGFLTSLVFQSLGRHGTRPGISGSELLRGGGGGHGSQVWASQSPEGSPTQIARPQPPCGSRMGLRVCASNKASGCGCRWDGGPTLTPAHGLHSVPTLRLRGDSGLKHLMATGGAPQSRAPFGRP